MVKRLLFLLLMIGGIAVTSYFVLVCAPVYFSGETDLDTGIKYLTNIFENLEGFLKLGFNALTAPVYGVLVFLLINVVLILTLALMVLFNGGGLSRIRKFYTISVWFFVAALLFSGAYAYSILDTGADLMESLKDFTWQIYVPFASSVVLLIVAVIFRKSERIY